VSRREALPAAASAATVFTLGLGAGSPCGARRQPVTSVMLTGHSTRRPPAQVIAHTNLYWTHRMAPGRSGAR